MYSNNVEKILSANGISTGDTVTVKSEKGSFTGILMPRTEAGDGNVLVLKLQNGYNIGISADAGTKITRLAGANAPARFPKVSATFISRLDRVSLLYTGGTIGSKIDYATGGVHMLIKPDELLAEVPELYDVANIDVKELMSIASEDMTHTEWAVIANAAAEALNGGARGIVITHGTDTMHYTSAALSFMLQGLKAPVVLTGAQRSSDRGSSDAFMNLICSARLAVKSDIAEVGICMHESMSDDYCIFIRGTRARKMHTSRRDAFKPVNSAPIARISAGGKIEYAADYRKPGGSGEKVRAVTGFESKVALIKAHPNSDPGVIDFYSKKGYRGIIIEGTGLGHVPVNPSAKEYSWLGHIRDAVGSGMVVGITSQCIYGRTNENVYRNLRLISGAGAIYCEDMLPETAYVKLGFLLGNYNGEEASAQLSKNLSGEISSRTEITA